MPIRMRSLKDKNLPEESSTKIDMFYNIFGVGKE
jgi:hypothetical protein